MQDNAVYQVADWNKSFEGAKSRTYNNKSTCSMPTKHGLGYKKLVRSKNGAALFGAWCALIQVLSLHDKPREGYCTDTGRISGHPYKGTDLEMLTDIPAKCFNELFKVAQSIGWLTVTKAGIPQGYHKDTTVSPRYPLNSDSDLDSDPDPDPDSKKTAAAVAFKSLCDAFTELNAKHGLSIPVPRSLTDSRRKRLKARLAECDDVAAVVEGLGRSIPWLKGFPLFSFDWAIENQTNWAKLCERKFAEPEPPKREYPPIRTDQSKYFD